MALPSTGMTITEKILASRAGKASVRPGELIFAKVDFSMGSDVTVPLSAVSLRSMGTDRLHDPSRVAMVQDHFVPAKDIASAKLSKATRDFAASQPGVNYFEVGRAGICHTVIPDEGLVVPGDVVVGADSHTCTYGALGNFATGVGSTDLAAVWALGETWFKVPSSIKVVYRGKAGHMIMGKDLILAVCGKLGIDGATYQALEFTGEPLKHLNMNDRFTITNMAIECGAKNGIIAVDDVTLAYGKNRWQRKPEIFNSDPDAEYAQTLEIDLDGMEPQVAAPFLPSNVKGVSQVAGVKIDQVFIGSCTNGRIEDYRIAAAIMGDRKVHPRVRMLIIPASHKIQQMLVAEGLMAKFLEAGAEIGPSTCGPCIGGHMGILAGGEVGFYTSNRNFVGRNGAKDAQVYLGSPAIAAATAVAGEIVDPRPTAMGAAA
jgi:3-isopropylmalate/(R)-2-methylmalate dehydratase large subunit